MASRFVVGQSLRSYSAQAVAKTEHVVPKPEGLKVSSLKNGLTVASLDNHGALSTVGIVVRAGPRNETYENAGAAHMLRIAAGLSTTRHTQFNICRTLQQAGSGLSCTQGREHTVYSIQATRDKIDTAAEYITDVVSNQAFKPWELGDNLDRMKLEISKKAPGTEAMELLHAAAFRTGLGNSLYCPAHKIGSHKPEVMQQFVAKNLTTDKACLVGINVPHSVLQSFAEFVNLESGSGAGTVASKFYSGEERREIGGNLAYVALAAPAPGATSVKDALACMLLQRVLGTGAHVKRGGSQGKLGKAAASAAAGNCAVGAIGPMYSDAGLIGAMIVAEAESAGKIVSAVAAALRSVTVTEADVAAAKKKLIGDVLTVQDSSVSLMEDIGTQVLLAGDVIQADKIPGLVNGVGVADVQAAAKKIAASKFAIGATGNLSTVPHLDSL